MILYLAWWTMGGSPTLVYAEPQQILRLLSLKPDSKQVVEYESLSARTASLNLWISSESIFSLYNFWWIKECFLCYWNLGSLWSKKKVSKAKQREVSRQKLHEVGSNV